MVQLDPDAFLTQLTRILERSRGQGTLYVTFKRYAGKEGKRVNEVDPAECRCLVRAVGAKQKISAMISAKDHRRFMQSYGNIMKVSLDSLKKKEKKKTEKKKPAQ
uniref:Signal recognition particle 14 kDa protein n=1 Tax=Haptolina ericina TaxID=156174 RepID=A0A7S3BJB0_9EUKA|mmetsp:Transcript_5958/g.13082  ORF Transcript_5958/g.13082 Transcript_5958/m.13082 type:complete len:105 (+) Transcript_5958:58-372(+)